MKTLLLMRHAKSDQKSPNATDHGRTLTDNGKKQAIAMGQWLKQQHCVPEYIMCSSALRANNTAQLVAKACEFNEDFDERDDLYLTSNETYVQQIQQADNNANRILVVGHNPTAEVLLHTLTDEFKNFAPASIAKVSLSIDCWSHFELNTESELSNFWEATTMQNVFSHLDSH